jgi:hypothetical protein
MAVSGAWTDVEVRDYMMSNYQTCVLSDFSDFQFNALAAVVRDRKKQ